MTLGLALNNALAGLRLNQQSIGVLSQNIANVNTVGYSRQIVNQSAVTLNGLGAGVKIDDIARKIDAYLQRSVQTQGSNNSSAQTISTYYQNIQNLLGQPGAGNSMDAVLTNFFNSIQQMAESPDVTSLKGTAVASATAIAKQMSDLALNVNDLRFQADRDISDTVTSINGTLDRLYNINLALSQAKGLNQGTAGLEDERDKALTTLSQALNISVTFAPSGAATVIAGNGSFLLEESARHQLSYSKAQSVDVFANDNPLGALSVLTLNERGEESGSRTVLLSTGSSSQVKSTLTGGTLDGLQQMRDVKLPAILDQLDQMASHLRDSVNAIHNNGSAYPPPTSLTGDRVVRAGDQYDWQGQVRIAVLQTDGKPVASSYADEGYTGVRPLTLDLSRLNSGQGSGKPTMQTIIDEINNHFAAPGNKAELGNLNNIQLVADTNKLPSGAISLFNFGLDMENISDTNAKVFVTGMTVRDDSGANITNVTKTAPTLTLQPNSSYTTTSGSADVTIALTSPVPSTVAVGDKIYLNAPSGTVNGISPANLTGFFTVSAISGNQITFTAGAAATANGSVNDAGAIQMYPPYDTVGAGLQERTSDRGELQVDFSGNLGSRYYDVTVNVSVVGEDGIVHTAPVTYRVPNGQDDLLNKRYSATTAGAPATIIPPNSSQQTLRAILVDASGKELPTLNGKYVDADGYLKIVAGNPGATYGVAIDELDSKQLGKPDELPAEAGTKWGFSHYFGLNNLFASNQLTNAGDTVHNSASNLKLEDRFASNPALISVGNLTPVATSVDTNGRKVYTYARYSGDNSVAQAMGLLSTQVQSFDSAGGLPKTQLSLMSYTSEILGSISQNSAEATANAANAKTLYDGFKSKSDAISGVNLDEELANTVTLQNAYSATARIITTVNKMYDDLLQAF